MICQARRCTVESLDGFDLCDPHMEREENGETITRRKRNQPTGPRPPRQPVTLADMRASDQKAAIRVLLRDAREERQARQAQAALLKPRCAATTAHGGPCARAAKYGPFCYTHRHMEPRHV